MLLVSRSGLVEGNTVELFHHERVHFPLFFLDLKFQVLKNPSNSRRARYPVTTDTILVKAKQFDLRELLQFCVHVDILMHESHYSSTVMLNSIECLPIEGPLVSCPHVIR